MPSLNTLLAHHIVDQSITLLRLSAGLKHDVMGLLNVLESELIGKLAGTKLTAFNDARWRSMMSAVSELTGATFDRAGALTQRVVQGVMEFAVRDVANTVRGLIGIDLLGRTNNVKWLTDVAKNSLTQGATNAQWWNKQNQELVFRFEQQVKLGMIANETTDKIIARIRGDGEAAGVLFQTRANAAALAQTAVAEGANDARLAMYRRNADIIRGVQQISTLDERTTEICIAYDLAAWDLDGNPIDGNKLPFNGGPPRHWNCRSTLAPIIKSSAELGTDVEISEGTRASMDGQVSEKTSFGDWLETKSPEQQDAILGKGKAQLWRDGKITLRELLDQNGRPLTLEQLQAQSKASPGARYEGLAKEHGGVVSGTGRPALVNINAIPSNDELFTQDRVLKAANNLGFPPDKIVFDYAEEKFMVGGTEYTLGGRALSDGRVQINVRGILGGDVEGLTAHEIQHIRFASVLDAYAKDSEAMMKDARVGTFESGRKAQGIMRASGELFDEFKKDYPVYTELEPFINRAAAELAKDDGVTQYSRDWWKEAAGGTASTHSAVNETLSEIARGRAQLLQTGIAPTKVWNDYFDAVESVFNKYLKP